ncbi:site-specific integrase [Methylophilaceae bacterium]|nr:site-specific integrase [Methylophilaceae bacterium]
MPQKGDDTIHINDGDATLFKRGRSPYWQLRYKKAIRGWYHKSLGTEDLADATKKAKQILSDSDYEQRHGTYKAPTSKFRTVAQLTEDRLNKKSDGKNNAYHQTLAIRKYLIPFFGNSAINKLDSDDFENYVSYVAKELKRNPSLTTIRKHNGALKEIYKDAVKGGNIAEYEIPKKLLPIKRKKPNKRGSFTNKEYQFLVKYMENHYEKEGRNGNEKKKRAMLRDHVLFLANSGVRFGTESSNIKWRHINWVKDVEGKELLEVYIENSKTDKGQGRRVGIRTRGKDLGVARALKRIMGRSEKYKDLTLDEMLKKKVDSYVFREEGDKNFTTNMGRMFRTLMDDLEMKYDTTTHEERTLYSLRHFYISMAIRSGMDVYQLARMCGTSVKMIDDFYGDDSVALNYKGLSY